MLPDDAMHHGERVMTVCNACRYCEQYCPVFPAMENRLTFSKSDLTYLANLCHNCGECLYSCQYAPPHEFGINVPRTMAQIRLRSYEEYGWPRRLGVAFRHHGVLTALTLSLALSAFMFTFAWFFTGERLWVADADGDFYSVVPHHVMVAMFGAVSVFVLAALAIGLVRFWSDQENGLLEAARPSLLMRALGDALSLRHLHGNGADCTSGEEVRSPWRRWFHHLTFGGFMLCFASTSVAALYHSGFGWQAPYGYTSVPVVLGTVGGIGLLIGPAGLAVLRWRRDEALGDPAQQGLDVSFIALLFLTSLTGLMLLVFRERAAMASLLIVHLGFVLTLFLTLPYGKFVHGIYRTAALIKYALESSRAGQELEPAEGKASLPLHGHGAERAHVVRDQVIPVAKVR